jgi:hypothetical protein
LRRRRTRVLDCLHAHLQALLQRLSSTGVVPLIITGSFPVVEIWLAEGAPGTIMMLEEGGAGGATSLPAN